MGDLKMKETEVKQLVDDNFMFLTMLGYATAIIFQLEGLAGQSVDKKLRAQINWFKKAIENIVYKKIPPPPIP